MKLINIGFGNLVSQERLVAIVSPDSAPIKRMVQETCPARTLIAASVNCSQPISLWEFAR